MTYSCNKLWYSPKFDGTEPEMLLFRNTLHTKEQFIVTQPQQKQQGIDK